jgi:hypothetical protein
MIYSRPHRRSNVNTVIKSHFVSGLCLLLFVGAVQAAAPVGDGQEQARLLLSGGSVPSNDTKYRSVASKSVTLDAQGQARQMILGPVISKASIVVGPPGERAAEVDALEQARRMILGTHAGALSTKARLARRAE